MKTELASSGDPVLPLLDYALSTTPRPIQVSTPGTILVVASNPGGYSDIPEQDYVVVDSIVFDFGPKGADASNLTTVDGTAWKVIAPAGWTTPTVSGLKFTFIPPPDQAKIFPANGLQFTFSQIPVNATVGTATLAIGETASSPGNPAEPDFYPPQPRALRKRTRPIGKFPVDFSVGDLTAQPPEVPVGGATVLAWSGSAGAAYEISYNGLRVTQHADGTLLQPQDTYPKTSAGDPALSVSARTTFTLTVTYTPPGGSDPAIFQRQVTVSVYSPQPDISLFTATPEFIQVPAGSPSAITLTWTVKNGRTPDCVAFTVTPPLPTFPATGKDLRHELKYSQPITLTAYGEEGTTPVSQTKDILIAHTAVISQGIGKYSVFATVSPDGDYAFVLNQASQSISVIATPGTDVTTWSTIATLEGLPKPLATLAFASSAAGKFLLVTTGDINGGSLTVITVTSAAPAQWPRVTLKNGMSALSLDVSTTPNGAYVFVTCSGSVEPPAPTLVSIFTINGSNPQQWPVFSVKLSGQPVMLRSTAVSPLGDYAFITALSGDGPQLWAITLKGSDPAQWPVARLNINGGETGIAFSPDRKFGVSADFSTGLVRVFDLSASDPAQWRLLDTIAQGMKQPMFAAFSPDGAYVFATNPNQNFVTLVRVSSDPPSKWKSFQLTQGISNQPMTAFPGSKENLTFITNANTEDAPGSLAIVAIAPQLPPGLAMVVTPPQFRPRRPANQD
jgi:WD40 repeat protein